MSTNMAIRLTGKGAAKALNQLSREQMKHKLLADIRTDLMICEIEGWSKKEYIKDLQELLNAIKV